MTAPMKAWENTLQNSSPIINNSNIPSTRFPIRSAPVLPPRPQGMSSYNSYSAYNSPYNSYGSSYGGFGGSYPTMGYRSSMYGGGGYGGYGGGSYGMYGMSGGPAGMYGANNDAEARFIQFAEERSRNTFANVENIVRAFNSMAMMLDNTFFAMTSSFRAVLGVAENFGRLRSMFAQIWHAVNVFRLAKWFYLKMMRTAGFKLADSSKTLAWSEALNGAAAEGAGGGGSSWSTIAFIGVLMSAPYLISKLLPKYEDKLDPESWKSSGIPAKAAFDYVATAQNELSIQTNDNILLAPKAIQTELKLINSGWAYATNNGRSGVVPLNYLVVMKRGPNYPRMPQAQAQAEPTPVPQKKHVSFGENQVFEMKEEVKEDPSSEGTSVATE